MKTTEMFANIRPKPFETSWTAPANIAFVKYWGKKGPQLPANPSVSMTLKDCVTKTKVKFSPADKLSVSLTLPTGREERFALKIKNYLESLNFAWMKNLSVEIETQNTFPHGAGIASSASGLSAFVLGLTEYMYHSVDRALDHEFHKTASFYSRLASGSACRSLFGGFVSWGDESDEYGTQMRVHPEFQKLQDSILVISGEEKKVSSRQGHERMKEHAYAEARYVQAKNHYQLTKDGLINGDWGVVGKILEAEALAIHALMLTSPEPYTLLLPNSLVAMEKVRQFRHETKLPVFFTLDAGPNLHLIHPESAEIKKFIQDELSTLTQNIIYDSVGEGPRRC